LRLALVLVPALALGAALVTLGLRRGEPLAASAAASTAEHEPAVRRVTARGQLGPGPGTIVIAVEPPAGAKLTEDAPLVVEARGEHLSFPKRIREPLAPAKLPVRLPVDVTDGATGPANIKLGFYWCTEGHEAACRPERVELEVKLDLTGDAAGGEAFFTYRAER
jgi:hypothetical protein